MAKIVYYENPLDKTKTREIQSHGFSIGSVLQQFGIQNLPLSVTINGETPDDCDLDYVPSEYDVVEIRRPLEGGNSRTKSDIGMIIQIAALVAASFFTGGVALTILLAGQVVSGVFQKWSMDLAGKPTGADVSDVDTSSNAYSLSTATNEARQLRPMPLVMGSHRLAPDVYADTFRSVFGEDNTISDIEPLYIDDGFYPGQESSNGAAAAVNNWALMPASYIEPGFPVYPIRIAPYHWNLPPGPISTADNTRVINDVRDAYFNGDSFVQFFDLGSEVSPLVIYHENPDMYFTGRYNLFFILVRQHLEAPGNFPRYGSDIGDAFSGANVNYLWYLYSNTNAPSFTKDVIQTSPYPSYYPSSIGSGDSRETVNIKYGAFLLDLNGGSYAAAKTQSYPIEKQILRKGLTSVVKEGIPYSTQVFNYGIGDLTVTDRKVGALEVGQTNNSLAIYQPVKKDDPLKWFFIPIEMSDANFAQFHTEILSVDSKRLINVNDPDVPIDVTDMNQYNFSYFEGKRGMNYFSFTVTGNLYSTNTSTGFGTNTCDIEIQYKFDYDTMWRTLPNHSLIGLPSIGSYLTINNNNTKKITYRVLLNPDGEGVPVNEQIIQVRIRKMTLDDDNNNGANVCNLSVDDIRFFKGIDYYSNYPEELRPRKCINIEGLFITALVTDYVQSNKLNALVQAKCWVYDFDTEEWSWEYTRNPAFWFLYFARGGYLNEDYEGDGSYPYSPTIGWVNYTGMSGSTDHLFGVGLTDEKIDMERVLEWAQFCEDKELNYDMVLKDDTSSADVLERICNSGRGSVTYISGKLSVIFEDPEQVQTCMFGMGNIIAGSFSVDYMVSDPVTKVIGKYVNRETWESDQVEAVVPFSDDPFGKVIEVNLEGITEAERAQREVNILAARQYYQRRTYTWSTDAEGMLAKRGDLVSLSHDSTQYGFSGRIMRFYRNDLGVITGIKVSSILDSSINYVTIRSPDGALNVYACTVDQNTISFVGSYPLGLAPYYVNDSEVNSSSSFIKSIAEDFVFIAGSKNTPGKIVRISESLPKDDGNFEFKAIDEDPAMWAREYDEVIPPESFDDSEVVLSLKNVQSTIMENGLVKINWESVNGDFIEIINEDSNLPLEANGAYSFTGGEVILELVPNTKYHLIIRPFAIGTPFKSVSKRIFVWSK